MIDYEKAYKDALERAKMILCNIPEGSASVRDIETIFPELRESEDERIRRTLVEYFGPKVQLDFVRGVPIQKIRDWLEKQKECVADSSKTSADEDEVRLINTSISFLKDFADKGYENAVECIDWLKSLSPQPHWKPSEEQMKALLKVVDKARELHYSSNSGYDEYYVLRSLYEQIKKLM